MSIKGLGIDIVEIARFEKHGINNAALAKRVLTETEYQRFLQHAQPQRFLAKRFAAKEAAVKALGTGIADGVSFQDIEVSNNASGKPIITARDRFKAIATERGITAFDVSISDEKHYVVANVVLS